ncbi:MAG: efflux RND transporter periplasmic adaptor subunit [Bryobacterales bacterium]|nr:efflux RND transporter periplasmic adaptor subunit [Bryobacterales bacterium]
MVVLGAAVGLGVFQSTRSSGVDQAVAAPSAVATVVAEKRDFRRSIRIGGTVGATNFAMIRAPRMRGGRDRGGGSSLTIQTLAEAGTVVQAGEVVAEFESKDTQDKLDTYSSMLAQTRAEAGTRKAEILIATETLRQDFRTTKSEAEKSELDLQTAEVRSAIQAEIFDLMAQEGRASTDQLRREVELQELANEAESRSLDLTVEQDQKRMDRTSSDLEKMRIRTPVGGLVVIETMFQRGNFQQASPGDQIYGGAFFMRVVDLSNMAVFANLNQADSQLVRLGVPVKVQLDAYPDVVFEGRVSSVGAMAVSGGGGGGGRRGPPGSSGSRGEWIKQVPVEIEILASDERIQPDLSASGDVIIEELENVLVVPRASLDHSDGQPAVWVKGSGDEFVRRPVELVSVSDTEAVVGAGLSAGDLIASRPIVVEESELAMR